MWAEQAFNILQHQHIVENVDVRRASFQQIARPALCSVVMWGNQTFNKLQHKHFVESADVRRQEV